jgi:hypothetical protein
MNKIGISRLLHFWVRQVSVVVFGLLLCVAATVVIALVWGWGNLFEAGPLYLRFIWGCACLWSLRIGGVSCGCCRCCPCPPQG